MTPPDVVVTRLIMLTGGMVGFDWGFDGRRFGDHEPIEVDEGEWVALSIENTTSMWHPVHLHGKHRSLVGHLAERERIRSTSYPARPLS